MLSGVPYAAIPGVRPLELDLWLPPVGGAAVPVVVFLHGGGWRLGSRNSAGPALAGAPRSPFTDVASAGIAVASIDYRLSGEASWPAQLHDAKAAARWLRARSAELGIDPERIASWGESAGGHLAALVALTSGDATLEGQIGIQGPSSHSSAVVTWYAPTDLPRLPADLGTDPMAPDTREALLLGAPLASVPETAAQASPITYVAAGAPSFLLLHGISDRFIPCVQSERMHAALIAAGVDAELHRYEGADHMWLDASDVAADAVKRTIAFLRGALGMTGSTNQDKGVKT